MTDKNPLADYAFLLNDIDSSGDESTNNKISIVADDLRNLGMDIIWVATYTPFRAKQLSDDVRKQTVNMHVEHANPSLDQDEFLYKAGATVFTNQNTAHIKDMNKTHLVIAGYHVNACTLRTIKNALEQGYHVTFLADCTNTKHIDYKQRTMQLTKKFPNEYDLGENPYKKLSELYGDKFKVMSHLDFLRNLEQETGLTSRILSWAKKLYGDRSFIRKWNFV